MQEGPTLDIWPPYEAFYIEAMLFSTKSALDSLEIANHSLDRCHEWESNPDLAAANRDTILDHVQNIVSCGAALSRYFWPSRTHELHAKHARRLRSSLGVADSSPLKNPRTQESHRALRRAARPLPARRHRGSYLPRSNRQPA